MNILQRISSETPKFWVRVQIVCLFLSAVIGWLMGDHVLPATVGYVAAGICGGGAAFAQLAVKDAPIIQEAINDPGSLAEHLPQLMADMATVKTAITDHIPASFADVAKAVSAVPDAVASKVTVAADTPPAPTPAPTIDNSVQAKVDAELAAN